MKPVVLRTRRLVLSLPAIDDVDAIHAACQDAEIQLFTPIPSPYERHHAEEFVTKAANDWDSGAHLTWAIRKRDVFVGIIGLYRLDVGASGELGYWISPWSRRRGFLTESASAVLDWGFSAEGASLRRIEWRAVVGNFGSARAARNLGFRYEGTVRQGLASPRGRQDGWIAGLLNTDDRVPEAWPVMNDGVE